MPISDHYKGGMTERLLVSVITVDPAHSQVEVVGKDAAVIPISVLRIPALFRWPVQGEYWTIIRENGEWALEEKLADPDDRSLATLEPGEAMIQTEKIWTPSGNYLVTSDEGVPSGGTAGQILSKGSNADWDTEWISSSIGGGSITLDSWHLIGAGGEPAFANSWVNDTGAVTKFRKDPFGKVRLVGRIRGGTLPGIAFTLPVGYRPPQLNIFDALSNNGTTDLQSQLRIGTDGTVTITSGTGANWFTLDGIEFDTETVTSILNTMAAPMEAFHTIGTAGEPAYQNGFAQQTSYNVRFRKDPFGKVKISGVVNTAGATAGVKVAFTMPVGYRPSGNERDFLCQGQTAVQNIYVSATDGGVYVPGNVGYIYLDSIEFDTETVTNYVVGAIPNPPEAWRIIGAVDQPAFGAGCTASITDPPQFRKHLNVVWLRGVINTPTTGNPVLFTLPSGYWPDIANQRWFPWPNVGFVAITSSGVVQGFTLANGTVDLSTISFSVG